MSLYVSKHRRYYAQSFKSRYGKTATYSAYGFTMAALMVTGQVAPDCSPIAEQIIKSFTIASAAIVSGAAACHASVLYAKLRQLPLRRARILIQGLQISSYAGTVAALGMLMRHTCPSP